LHTQAKVKEARLAHHTELNFHLREHIEDIFAKPVLHRVMHLLNPRTQEKDLLEAMMAACALVASSRGRIDDIEKEYLRKNLGSVELFRHVESAVAIAHFEQYAKQLEDGKKEAALRKLMAISDEPKLSHLVMSVAHGMTSLHGEVLSSEEAALQEVASAMKTTASLEELVAQARKNS